MAILYIDKLNISRPVVGINCSECGGILHLIEKKSILEKVIATGTLGIVHTKHYECVLCHKKFILII